MLSHYRSMKGFKELAPSTKWHPLRAVVFGERAQCMEPAFDKLGAGVVGTISGYTGGSEENPTYLQVSGKETHHREAVQVVYDPTKVSYEQLLDAFWHSVNPTQDNGQFVDIGPQYTTAIYCYDEEQLKAAEASKSKLQASGVFGAGKPIVTEIIVASELPFWPAEKYHQNYYKNRAMRYKLYRSLSGRDDFIQSIWGPDFLYNSKHVPDVSIITLLFLLVILLPVRGNEKQGKGGSSQYTLRSVSEH
eukprot:1939599-Pyramimonas_sp.AAC.2